MRCWPAPNTGQASLIAKDDLLRQCPPADIVVFGDSRAEAALNPRLIASPTVTFARGGGSPVEDYFRLQRYIACGRKPRLVILSYTLPEFVRLNPQGFWKGTAIAHLLPLQVRDQILSRLLATGRSDVLRLFPDEGSLDFASLPARLKNILYELYFPLLYAPSLANSLENSVVFRYRDSARVYQATLANHGRSDYYPLPHDAAPGREAGLWTAEPNPAINEYLQALLGLLQENDIPTLLMVMPVNDATFATMPVPVREKLMAYLNSLPSRFPNVVVADQDLPHWPARYFGDAAMHLGPEGSAAVAAILNLCLKQSVAQPRLDACQLSAPPS